MAAELTTTKLNADSHVLLDQPLLRLPHELIKRNFRNTQRYVEREKEHILPTLKDTANASLNGKQTHEQTLASLDAMINRMQTFKRKLDKLSSEEEALHSQTNKRIKHLQDLYTIPSLTDVKYDTWSRTRLDRLIVDYLLRSGYSSTATILAESKQITDLIDLETFITAHRIATSLRQSDPGPALTWLTENKNSLKKLIPPNHKTTNLEFELRLQQYIELLRIKNVTTAVQHAHTYLSPHYPSRPESVMHLSGLLACRPASDTLPEPYSSLFSPSRWPYLAQLFIETHHTLLNLPVQPLLHVALSAGLSALKTPACHSQYNPASSSTPGHARIATNTSLCPICSMELNDLARNVPYAHHTTSSVENEPVVLPNGRIYGRERLEELQRKLAMAGLGGSAAGHGSQDGGSSALQIGKEGDVRDPTTGETFPWDRVRKAYIM